jgi:hypothetical protein
MRKLAEEPKNRFRSRRFTDFRRLLRVMKPEAQNGLADGFSDINFNATANRSRHCGTSNRAAASRDYMRPRSTFSTGPAPSSHPVLLSHSRNSAQALRQGLVPRLRCNTQWTSRSGRQPNQRTIGEGFFKERANTGVSRSFVSLRQGERDPPESARRSAEMKRLEALNHARTNWVPAQS